MFLSAFSAQQVPLPQSTSPFLEIFHAVIGAAQVYPGAVSDAMSGHFTISDAVAVGFETGGLLALPFAPGVGLFFMGFAGEIWSQSH